MSDDTKDAERIRRRLPDYFKALEMPWHLAASFMAAFVDDDEESLGMPTGHALNLFHAARALNEESTSLRQCLAVAEKERDACAEDARHYQERLQRVVDASSDPETKEALEFVERPGDRRATSYAPAANTLARALRSSQAKLADEEKESAKYATYVDAGAESALRAEKAESELQSLRRQVCTWPAAECHACIDLEESVRAREKVVAAADALAAELMERVTIEKAEEWER